MVAKAIPIPRGCGTRQAGGIYLETGHDPNGQPVEYFLLDPPFKLVPEAIQAMGLRPIGVTPLERDGVTHILDWVGSIHYPNVADFVEEVRRAGLSRRIPKGFDFSLLSEHSRILVVHARGWLNNAADYYEALRKASPANPYSGTQARPCPKSLPGHNDVENPPPMCCQVWWQDVEGGEPVQSDSLAATRHLPARYVRRTMPAFEYFALQAPDGATPSYTPAIFGSFPISRVAVIQDRDGGTHVEAVKRASQARLPVELEDE